MPKVKKIRAPALASKQARQEPLGQVIQGDEKRGKYAAPIRGRRKHKKHANCGTDDGGDLIVDEYLDPKTSHKILSLSREQQLQIQLEEQQQEQDLRRQKRQQKQQKQRNIPLDSDEEDEQEEVEEVFLDEGDE